MLILREMTLGEMSRVTEIDVSEEGTFVYRQVGGGLDTCPESWRRPRRDWHGWHREAWMAMLALDGIRILGAFDEACLVGIAVLRPQLTGCMAQLAALFVNRAHRRQGVARKLVAGICAWDRESGARALYVSATPSESAVGFYRSQGFGLADQVHPELFALEPEDIHMIKTLDSDAEVW